jgi:hypothetical protein
MKTRTFLAAAAALVLLLLGSVPVEAGGPHITGRLTVLNNEFILKLYEPFSHDDSEAEDGSEIVTATELHVRCDDDKKARAELRALLGKDVRFPYAGVYAANSPRDCRPLVLPYGTESERVMEVYPPGHELAGWPRDREAEAEAKPSPSLVPMEASLP